MERVTYLLCCTVLIALASFAQGHETFDHLSISGSSYTDGTFQGQDGSIWEFTQARGDSQINGKALLLGQNRSPRASLTSGIIANGVGTLKFSYKQAFSSNVRMEVYVNDSLVYVATSSGQQNEVLTTDEIEVNISGDVFFRFSNPTTTAGQVSIDDIQWTAMQQVPRLHITHPLEGEELAPLDTAKIAFNIHHFHISSNTTAADGDGYLQYSVDGSTFINHFSADTIILEDLHAGEHQVKLRLVDNHGQTLNPEVEQQVRFTSHEVVEVSSIAMLRQSPLDAYYIVTEEVILTFQQEFAGQKYIQDASAAILLQDEQEILTEEFEIKDGITGISGKLEEHNGSLRFLPIANTAEVRSTDNTISVQVLSISDYMSNPSAYESQLIGFRNVHFVAADGTLTFATGQNYEVSDGNDLLIMRSQFYDADYIGEIVPEGTQTAIIGIAAHYYNNGQFYARSLEDLYGTTLSTNDFKKEDVGIFPNPAVDRFFINTNSKTQVKVFSILGKQVIHTQITDNKTPISLQDLKPGVYMVQITQDGKIRTRKLIVK